MQKSATSVAVWRCFILLLALVAAVQLAIEIWHAPRTLSLGIRAEKLFEGSFLRERGPTTFVVDALPPGSPLIAAGVMPGDHLQWDAPVGRFYNVAAGEAMILTVVRGDNRRRIEFTMPAALQLPRHQVANFVLSVIIGVFGLVLGVTLGWRRADLTAYRGLAACAVLATISFPYSAPAGAHIDWLDFASSISSELALGALIFFAINYPDDHPSGWRATLKRCYPWIFGVQVLAEMFYYGRLYTGSHEPALRWIFRTYELALPALFLVTILATWKQARGEARVRLQWIIATLGVITAAVLLSVMNRLAGMPVPGPDVDLILNGVVLAAMLGLTYAIVKRRIFDFGLAVNRTLVIAIVGGILLGVFQIAHAIMGRYLQFGDRNQALVLSAVLAIATYLSFTYLKKPVERFVDRVFFNHWTVREQELRRFVKEARYASDEGALGSLLVAAIDRYTGNAGCAVYRRQDNKGWRCTEGSLAVAPHQLDANHETVLALAAHEKALPVRAGNDLPDVAWAFPMSQRGKVVGLVLTGPLCSGDSYRPDQIEALEAAVQKVGVDAIALRIEHLESELAKERAEATILRAQLATATMMAPRTPE